MAHSIWRRLAGVGATFAALAVLIPALVSTPALAQQKPIKIGFSMALTGPLGAGGKSALIAMEIWRDDVNAKGGLLGRPVEFVYYDDQTAPAKVPALYTKLLDVDQVDLVVSSYGTNVIVPAMNIIKRKKMVFPALFGLAVNDEFKYDRYFQIMPAGPDPKVDWSRGFLELAKSKALQTIALAAADAEFSQNAVYGARKNAQAMGFKIVYDKSYPATTTDFAPIVRAIQATNPDVVYVGSYPPDSVGMVKAANELQLKTKLFGGGMVGLQFAAIQKNLGPMLNGVVNYDFWVPASTLNFPGIDAFLKKYQQKAAGAGVDPLGHFCRRATPIWRSSARPWKRPEPGPGQARQAPADLDLPDDRRSREVRQEWRMGDLARLDGAVPRPQAQRPRSVRQGRESRRALPAFGEDGRAGFPLQAVSCCAPSELA
jgi:branched-chain amino acid transport system substrate-binding protein